MHLIACLLGQVGRERLDSLVFVSSEFLRARQTAEECRAALKNILSFERQAMTEGSAAAGAGGDEEAEGAAEGRGGAGLSLEEGDIGGYDVSPPVVIRQELRERSFGELEGTILVNYNKVHTRCILRGICTELDWMDVFGPRVG